MPQLTKKVLLEECNTYINLISQAQRPSKKKKSRLDRLNETLEKEESILDPLNETLKKKSRLELLNEILQKLIGNIEQYDGKDKQMLSSIQNSLSNLKSYSSGGGILLESKTILLEDQVKSYLSQMEQAMVVAAEDEDASDVEQIQEQSGAIAVIAPPSTVLGKELLQELQEKAENYTEKDRKEDYYEAGIEQPISQMASSIKLESRDEEGYEQAQIAKELETEESLEQQISQVPVDDAILSENIGHKKPGVGIITNLETVQTDLTESQSTLGDREGIGLIAVDPIPDVANLQTEDLQSKVAKQAVKMHVLQARFSEVSDVEKKLQLSEVALAVSEKKLQKATKISNAIPITHEPAIGITAANSPTHNAENDKLEDTAALSRNAGGILSSIRDEFEKQKKTPFTPILEHNLEKDATTGQQKSISSSFNIDNTKSWFKEARNQAVKDREVIDREITDKEVDNLFKSGAIAMDNEGPPQKMFYTKDLDKEKTIFFAAVTLEGISKSQPEKGDLVKATVEGCDDNEKFLLDVLTTFHERLNKQLNGEDPGKARCTTIEYIGENTRLREVVEKHNKFAEIINKEDIEDIATKKVKSASILNEIKVAKEMLLQEVEEPHSTSTAHHRSHN